MTQNKPDTERAQLKQAISHLEGQRGSLGDAVVDAALVPLREKLAQLDKRLLARLPAGSPAHVVAFLVHGRLTLARGEYHRAIGAFEKMLALFDQAGVRWLAADALYYRGQALLALGSRDEALASLRQARTAAEALAARRILWQIYATLAEVEPDAVQKQAYRDQARHLVQYIADHTGSEALSAAFLALPAVHALFDHQDDET